MNRKVHISMHRHVHIHIHMKTTHINTDASKNTNTPANTNQNANTLIRIQLLIHNVCCCQQGRSTTEMERRRRQGQGRLFAPEGRGSSGPRLQKAHLSTTMAAPRGCLEGIPRHPGSTLGDLLAQTLKNTEKLAKI